VNPGVYPSIPNILLVSLVPDEGTGGNLPNTGSGKVLEDALRNIDPALGAAWACILDFGNEGLSLIYLVSLVPLISECGGMGTRQLMIDIERMWKEGEESNAQLSCSL
jgi:hypothetical protein